MSTKLCPETGDPCYRMCLTMCHILNEDRVALRAETARLRAAMNSAATRIMQGRHYDAAALLMAEAKHRPAQTRDADPTTGERNG